MEHHLIAWHSVAYHEQLSKLKNQMGQKEFTQWRKKEVETAKKLLAEKGYKVGRYDDDFCIRLQDEQVCKQAFEELPVGLKEFMQVTVRIPVGVKIF